MEISDQINSIIKGLRAGESYRYHIGNLAIDRQRSYALDVTAKIIWKAYETGRYILYQRKQDGVFAYHIGRV